MGLTFLIRFWQVGGLEHNALVRGGLAYICLGGGGGGLKIYETKNPKVDNNISYRWCIYT